MNTTQSMANFVKWAMEEGPWDGCDLDGGGIQDKAESLGLIVRVPTRGDWFVLSPGVIDALETAVGKKPKKCDKCGINLADPPSKLCPGCEAYKEHQR